MELGNHLRPDNALDGSDQEPDEQGAINIIAEIAGANALVQKLTKVPGDGPPSKLLHDMKTLRSMAADVFKKQGTHLGQAGLQAGGELGKFLPKRQLSGQNPSQSCVHRRESMPHDSLDQLSLAPHLDVKRLLAHPKLTSQIVHRNPMKSGLKKDLRRTGNHPIWILVWNSLSHVGNLKRFLSFRKKRNKGSVCSRENTEF
jgi:hypothetical protein